MKEMWQLLKEASSANERPEPSTEIGRIQHPELGWLTLYEKTDGEIRYVTDHMKNYNAMMLQAERRRKREKRRRDIERFSQVHTNI